MAEYFGGKTYGRDNSAKEYEQRRRGESCTEAAGDPAASGIRRPVCVITAFSASGPSRTGIWRMVCSNRLSWEHWDEYPGFFHFP